MTRVHGYQVLPTSLVQWSSHSAIVWSLLAGVRGLLFFKGGGGCYYDYFVVVLLLFLVVVFFNLFIYLLYLFIYF